MFDALEIKNFRGFKDLKIAPLKRINLLAGENNVGKTNLLEGIFALFSPKQLEGLPSSFRPLQKGRDDRENFWMWWFYRRNFDERITIAAWEGSSEEFSLTIDLTDQADPQRIRTEPPPKSNRPIEHRDFCFTYWAAQAPSGPLGTNQDIVDNYKAAVAHGVPKQHIYQQYQGHNPSQGFHNSYGGTTLPIPSVAVFSTSPSDPAKDAIEYNKIVLKEGGEERIEDLLRIVEPRLKKIRSLQVGNQPLLYADIGLGNLIPVTQLGQGFNRLLTIFSAMLVSEAKILLIDEIENGLYYAAQKSVWAGLAEAARKNDVQIFATTHSWGCIVAAHEAFSEGKEYDFALHRIQRVKGDIESVTYDREMLETSLETKLEVR